MTAIDTGADPLLGKVLAGRYRIEARLGGGSMGAVYRARHIKVGRTFAVKVLHPHLLNDEKQRKRFAREAELAGTLHHPNVVGVVDVGEMADGQRYLVMEYAEGETLFGVIASAAPLPGPRVVTIAQQLCEGLSHAHEHGLIHRDFKSENVIIERSVHGVDTAKILDFGVAILRDNAAESGDDRLTTAGLVLGTPHYMAPEHATNQAIDHRIDLFALGVICYEMLTSRLPFDGDGVTVARANMMLDPPAMGVRVPHLKVDPLVEAFVRKLMSRNRDQRPESAQAARALLDLIVHDRKAAAEALGIEDDAPPAVATTYDDTVPIATVSGEISDDTAAVLRGMAMTPPPPSTHIMRVASSRAGLTVAGLAAAMVIATVVIALRPSSSGPAAPDFSQPAGVPLATGKPSPRAPAPPVAPAPPPAREPTLTVEPATAPTSAPETATAAPTTAARLGPAPAHSAPAPTAIPRTAPSARTAEARVATTAPAKAEAAKPTEGTAPRTTSAAAPAASTTAPAASTTAPAASTTAPAATVPPPAAPAQSAADIAQRYTSVGQHLKALEQQHGATATEDLWPTFLRLRLNDALSDPGKRAAMDVVLRALDARVAERAK